MKLLTIVSVATVLLATSGAWAGNGHGNGDGNGNGNGNSGFITETVVTEQQYMGMSDKAPPNEHAAASQGTRTETTTETVYGPPGQVNNYVDGSSETCANCTITSVTETTDLPGANR